jgi:hypothetical protein
VCVHSKSGIKASAGSGFVIGDLPWSEAKSRAVPSGCRSYGVFEQLASLPCVLGDGVFDMDLASARF